MECRLICTPRSSNTATLAARPISRAADAHVVLGDPGDGAVAGDVDVGQGVDDLVGARGVLGDPGPVDEALVDDGGGEGRDQPGVGAGPHLQVDVGQLGGLGAAGVDDDHRPGGVAGDLLQRGPGPGEAVALPGVLADEHDDLAVLDLAAHVGAEHLGVDPELAGLLLGQGVRAVPAGAEGGERGAGVGPAEVVPLPATAEVEDGVAAVGVAHGAEPGRHLADGGVPVDLLERAVGPAPQRAGQALARAGHAGRRHCAAAGVLVVVEPQGLLARVALRHRVRLVAADALEPAAVVAAEPHLDAAVALAEDAGGRVPLSLGGRGRRGCGRTTSRHLAVPPGSTVVGRADANPS